jgi:hypothetical protein
MTTPRYLGALGVVLCAAVPPVLAQEPIAIDPAPRVIVGPEDRLVTPFLLPSGEIAIPSSRTRTVAVYDAGGREVRRHDGAEAFALSGAWARGDTIEAFDWRRSMIVRFSPDGAVDSIAMGRLALSCAGGLCAGNVDAVLGPLDDGWAAVAIAALRLNARDSMSIHRLARDGDTSRRLAVVDGMHRELYDDGSGPHPLSPTALYAVHDDELYVADSLTPVIRVYDASGGLVREIAVPLVAPDMTPNLTAQVVDSAETREQENPTGMPVRWSGLEASRLSVMWDFIVDELGYVWVRPYDPWQHALSLDGRPGGFGGPGGRWLVLSPSGDEVGWIDVPGGLELVDITRDAVLGTSMAGAGAQIVRVHPLRRR